MCLFFLERATRLELASRYPANRLRRFVGALPGLGSNRASRGVEAASSLLRAKKRDIRLGYPAIPCQYMEIHFIRHPAPTAKPAERLTVGSEGKYVRRMKKVLRLFHRLRTFSELERATRLELATSTLARWRSTR